MLRARLLGVIATAALLAGTAACDSPTGVAGREAAPGAVYNGLPTSGEEGSSAGSELAQAQADAAEADSLVAEYTATSDTVTLAYSGPAGASTVTHIISLGGGDILVLPVPVGSTVVIYPDPSNPSITHVVVTGPDGSIVHYIWNPATGVLKKFEKPAKKKQATLGHA